MIINSNCPNVLYFIPRPNIMSLLLTQEIITATLLLEEFIAARQQLCIPFESLTKGRLRYIDNYTKQIGKSESNNNYNGVSIHLAKHIHIFLYTTLYAIVICLCKLLQIGTRNNKQ